MGIVRINNLLRSSLVKTCEKGESWRARASDSIGSVQARTVGITAFGEDQMVEHLVYRDCHPCSNHRRLKKILSAQLFLPRERMTRCCKRNKLFFAKGSLAKSGLTGNSLSAARLRGARPIRLSVFNLN